MGVRRPDPRRLGRRSAGARHVRCGHLGSRAGRDAHHPRRPGLATGMSVVDDTFWGARATSIDELERELARLRRAALAHAKERGRTLARASVLNLVVYSDRETHARRAARTVADLALRHPSRALVLLADRDREGVLASVQLHCHVPQ